MASAKKARWSYSTGEWGVNRVRVFARGRKGIFLEYRDRVTGPDGSTTLRKTRVALGHCDRQIAKAKADAVAAAFRQLEGPRPRKLTLHTPFDIYEAEVSPEKGESKRQHDRRCAEMFLRYFGLTRSPLTLSRRDWDRFITDRRRGAIAPAGVRKRRRVGDRVIAYDLKWLLAVFNWATVAGNGQGGALLERNPLKGLPVPRVESPARAVLTDEQYLALRAVGRRMRCQFELALVLAHETGHRIGAIRQLHWSDINLESGAIHWRASCDKIGLEHTTPLTDEGRAVLVAARAQRPAIGDAWVFPAPRDPSKPVSRDRVRLWWSRAAARAKLPAGRRLGWHSLRRKFATELKETPLKDLCHLGGWKNPITLLTCYQLPDPETQRAALARRRKFSGGSGDGSA